MDLSIEEFQRLADDKSMQAMRIADLERQLKQLEGPVLLEIRCACGARADLGRPTTTPVQNRDAFMAFLQDG